MKDEKMLKKFLKRKVKYNEALLVLFLITGNIIYGLGIKDDLNNLENIVEKNGNGLDILSDGSKINVKNIALIHGEIDKRNTIEKNPDGVKERIIGSGNGISNNTSVGLAFIGDIENNGSILGDVKIQNDEGIIPKSTSELEVLGNGISSSSLNIGVSGVSKMGRVLNNGLILGGIHIKNSQDIRILGGGNGINGLVNSNSNRDTFTRIESIKNSGVIQGEVDVIGGETISSHAGFMILGSGNGVSNYSSFNSGSLMGDIENEGKISGKVFLDGKKGTGITALASGNGISSYSRALASKIENIKNSGIIQGKIDVVAGETNYNKADVDIKKSGNGIASRQINKVENDGAILGDMSAVSIRARDNVDVLVRESANGIMVRNTESIKNNGVIFGKARAQGGEGNKSAVIDARRVGDGISGIIIKDIENFGVIKGEVELAGGTSPREIVVENGVDAISVGNGIDINRLNKIYNGGSIVGEAMIKSGNSIASSIVLDRVGNGISTFNENLSIINDGVVSGYLSTYKEKDKIREEILSSGYGIALNGDMNGNLINRGVIKGNQGAISGKGLLGKIENYGVLVGREIFSGGIERVKEGITNGGIYVKLKSKEKDGEAIEKVELDKDGNPQIEEINIGVSKEVILEDGRKMTTLNGEKYNHNGEKTVEDKEARDSYTKASDGESYKDKIINGVGIKKGALITEGIVNLDKVIVNGYSTAVYLENGSKVKAKDTIFNGGGLKGDKAVIKGGDEKIDLDIRGKSIVNGDIDLGGGDNILSLTNEVVINGNIRSGGGDSKLILGKARLSRSRGSDLNIFNGISGFKEISSNGNVVLFETSKISDVEMIDIKSGALTLKLDALKTEEKEGEKKKIIGHALYSNKGILSSSGGDLILGVNGLGKNVTIGFGETKISKGESGREWIKTNSLVLDATVDENGDIKVEVKDELPKPELPKPPIPELPNPELPKPPVPELPKPELPNPPIPELPNPELPESPAPEMPKPPLVSESEKDTLIYKSLNKVYTSLVTSGEIGALSKTTSLEDKSYNESLEGVLEVLNGIYSKNPYAYSINLSRDNLKVFEDNLISKTLVPQEGEWIAQGDSFYNSKTFGGMGTIEYGLNENSSFGFIFGGGNQKEKYKGVNRLGGNLLYVGTFTRKSIGNFAFIGGIGYQYSKMEVDRLVGNKYEVFKNNDKFNIDSFNAFVRGEYQVIINDELKFKPNLKFSYYQIGQGRIHEGYIPNNISIGVDRADVRTYDIELGIDIVKTSYIENGKINGILSMGVQRELGGKSKELQGEILGANKNGSKFAIKGENFSEVNGKIGVGVEYERASGVLYSVGVDYEVGKSKTQNLKTRIGLGYKF